MKFSLQMKTILLIAFLGLLVSIMAILIYGKGIHEIIRTQYAERSIDIAKTVAVELEKERVLRLRDAVKEIYESTENVVLSDQWGTPEFESYISLFSEIEKSEDFLALREHLRRIQDVNHVDCLYLTWLDTENERLVYLVDSAYEDACPPGTVDPIYGEFSETMKNPALGMSPNITNTPEYGWIVATDMPIFDDQGNVLAFSAVDISMNDIMNTEQQFMLIATAILLSLTAVVCVVGILLVRRFIVRPINELSHAAVQYSASNHRFSDLEINNRDEIGVLADSMVRMEKDLDGYIANLTRTRDELASALKRAEQMDIAANIDALTRVRNKRAYDVDAARLNEGKTEYGLAMIDLNGLKATNDTYGHEKGDASIKSLCQTVCGVFKHSPVYRVGGDEFIVILENDDFRDREMLIEQFRDKIREISGNESLQPWDRISAAIGCAVYDPGRDRSVEDVFNRADEIMYENKKKMKAE